MVRSWVSLNLHMSCPRRDSFLWVSKKFHFAVITQVLIYTHIYFTYKSSLFIILQRFLGKRREKVGSWLSLQDTRLTSTRVMVSKYTGCALLIKTAGVALLYIPLNIRPLSNIIMFIIISSIINKYIWHNSLKNHEKVLTKRTASSQYRLTWSFMTEVDDENGVFIHLKMIIDIQNDNRDYCDV